MLVLFFVTSSDSGSLVIDRITSGGKDNTPRIQRVIWAIIQGMIAIVLLVGGGSYALSAYTIRDNIDGVAFCVYFNSSHHKFIAWRVH